MTMQSPARHPSNVSHLPTIFARLHQSLRRAIAAEIRRKHHEAVLRSLDRRTLLDIGIAIDDPGESLSSDPNRESPDSLSLLFSLTRFGK